MNLINNLDPKCIESFFKSEVVDEISNQKFSTLIPHVIMLIARLIGKLGFKDKSSI